MIKLFNKKQKNLRHEKYGKLYELLVKKVEKATELGATKVCIGLPNKSIEPEGTDYIPVYFKVDQEWRKIYQLPYELHIPFLEMVRQFIVETPDPNYTDFEFDNKELDPKKLLDQLPKPNNKFYIDLDLQQFCLSLKINTCYNYEIEIEKHLTNGSN